MRMTHPNSMFMLVTMADEDATLVLISESDISLSMDTRQADIISHLTPPLSPNILPWDNFYNWLHCICVVTFDLEIGQAMELIYPGHVKLSEREKTNISYLSFPDSNSGCMGDTQFHFRIRRCQTPKSTLVNVHSCYNCNSPASLQSENGYLYGYVYFRQTRDKSMRRGYFQKSVVLISHLPLVNLFYEMIAVLAPEYFDNGEPCLEAACHDIDQWPYPMPAYTLNLPLMGTVMQVRIPCRTDKLIGSPAIGSPNSLLPANKIVPTVHEVDIYSSFLPILPHIQLLWELVILAEPVAVLSSLPTTCTQTVQGLVSVIWPLKYCADYRPFFTIHDSEFKEYTSKSQGPPSVILGVTNPFFAKTLQHWPHIIRISEMSDVSGKNPKCKKSASLKTLDSKPGVYTRYKPFLTKDKIILKRLAKGIQSKRPVEAQCALLRRYFLELTQSFMIPLERYVAGLMPLKKNISPHKGSPRLRPFEPEGFLATLEQTGPQLTSGLKGDWVGLYRKFFLCQNFQGWLRLRIREANQKLQAIHAEALSQANLIEWVQGKAEVEVVDLILRLRDKLKKAAANKLPISCETVEKLELHQASIISTLSDDLQMVMSQPS